MLTPQWTNFDSLEDGWHLFELTKIEFKDATTGSPIGQVEATVAKDEPNAGSKCWETFTFWSNGRLNKIGCESMLFLLVNAGVVPNQQFGDDFFMKPANKQKIMERFQGKKFGALTRLELTDRETELPKFRDFCIPADLEKKRAEYAEKLKKEEERAAQRSGRSRGTTQQSSEWSQQGNSGAKNQASQPPKSDTSDFDFPAEGEQGAPTGDNTQTKAPNQAQGTPAQTEAPGDDW